METASKPLVSVVTPVYNEEQYLAECIESVLSQTYQSWDYTIVDNCSTDGTLEIAKRYAAKDRRIRVVQNKEFLSVIPNHNRAIRQISRASKYCKLVLGDDWIFPDCLDRMVGLAEEQPSVGVVSAYSLDGRHVQCMGLPYGQKVTSGRKIARLHLLENLYLFGSLTTVLYRTDLVRKRDPFLNEKNIHSDTEVCFDLLKECDFGFVHQILTFSRKRDGSLSTKSEDVQSSFAGDLQILLKYGLDYLSRQELESCLDRLLSSYYDFLGKSVLLGRDEKFWAYHKKQLADAGVGFSKFRLSKGVLATLFRAAVNPVAAIKKFSKKRDNETVKTAAECLN